MIHGISMEQSRNVEKRFIVRDFFKEKVTHWWMFLHTNMVCWPGIDLWYYFESCCCLSAGSQVSGTRDVGLPGCWTRGWNESRGEQYRENLYGSFFCRTAKMIFFVRTLKVSGPNWIELHEQNNNNQKTLERISS